MEYVAAVLAMIGGTPLIQLPMSAPAPAPSSALSHVAVPNADATRTCWSSQRNSRRRLPPAAASCVHPMIVCRSGHLTRDCGGSGRAPHGARDGVERRVRQPAGGRADAPRPGSHRRHRPHPRRRTRPHSRCDSSAAWR